MDDELDRSPPRTRGGRISPALAVTAVLGLLIAALGTAASFRVQRNLYDHAFDIQSVALVRRIEAEIGRVQAMADTTRNREMISPSDRESFKAQIENGFSSGLLTAVSRVSIVRRVATPDIPSFEAGVREQTGLAEFSVHPAVRGTEAFVIENLVPYEGNEQVWGSDLSSDPVRSRAIKMARDQGKIAVSEPFTSIHGAAAVAIYAPLYSVGHVPGSTEARRESFSGAVSLVIAIEPFVSGAVRFNPEMDVCVLDTGPTATAARPRQGRVVAGGDCSPDTAMSTLDLNFGGRRWTVVTNPSASYPPFRPWRPYAVGGIGLLLMMLSTGLVWSMRSSLDRAEVRAAEMTESLSIAQRSLAEADRLKTAFIGTFSHEIRTPLTSVLGFVELLRTPGLSLEDRELYLQRIEYNVKSLEVTVSGQLDFVNVQRGVFTVHPEHLELRELISKALLDLSPILATHSVSLEPGDPVRMCTDPRAITRVLTNLASNAVRYSPEGSAVTVRVLAEGDFGVLEVKDRGVGVVPEERERIFEDAFRGQSSEVARRPGAGIGLSVVRELARNLGGDAEVLPNPGGGSIFRVRFARHVEADDITVEIASGNGSHPTPVVEAANLPNT